MGRAIVRDPDVFLFDEPLSNLDAKLRTQMRTEIKKLHAKVQSTVIYVTHDQVEAMTLADRIVIMRDGHIEQVGTPDEVFRRPATRFVAGFIGSPPMNLHEATIDDGQMVFASGEKLPLPDQFKANVAGRRQGGVRAAAGRHLSDRPWHHSGGAADVHQIELPVTVTEPLGNETLVFVEFNGTRLGVAHAESRAAEAGRDGSPEPRHVAGASVRRRRPARHCGADERWPKSKKSNCGWSTLSPRSSAPTRSRASSARRRRSSPSPTPTARSAPATATRSAPAARR